MIIKSIILKNIRSYLDEKIELPIGSVLLSGDIGSGKSTILLGIEFALFGFERKHLSGSVLLRNGKNSGFVELRFSINGKDIIIKRTLKRGKHSVRQESGYIIVDGTKKEATHVELKSIVLDLLGYPKELLTKSRDIVYKYTVYTPQDEMKQILIEEKEIRLETLRKVFQIDRYKRIRENSVIFIRELKERKREYEGMIINLDEKKQQLNEREQEAGELGLKLDETANIVRKIREELEEKKKNISEYEKNIKLVNELRNKLEKKELELKHKIEQRKRNNDEIEELEGRIVNAKKELSKSEGLEMEGILNDINSKKQQIEFMKKTVNEIRNKLNEFWIGIRNSEEIKKNISKMDKCPLCQQDVNERHRFDVTAKENEKIKKAGKELEIYTKQEKKAVKKLNELDDELEKLREQEKKLEVLKVKRESLKENMKKKDRLLKQQDEIKWEVGKINVKKAEINAELMKLKEVEKDYEKSRKEFEQTKEKEKDNEIKIASIKKEIEGIKAITSSLENEIRVMLKAKEKIKNLSQMQNWLEEYFIKLMSTIEKHVMFRIHREFNELFKSWFNILIEDETINVRLDDEFTPAIEQNGYETDIENLSGGEKTSCSLAYRLALNKVVNDLIGNIKTKDLIILDEPTDGFSTEQLDKIRDVIEQINMKQIIIVSHEAKIESFVDNIIRIRKHEHVSNVV